MIVYTYYDLVQVLKVLISGRLSLDSIGLYQGSHTPSAGDTTVNYLGVEANFNGYSRIVPSWATPALNADSIGQTSSNVITWSPIDNTNLPMTIGGVFALDSTLQLSWAELLPGGPVTLTAAGQTVSYQAVITMGEGSSSLP